MKIRVLLLAFSLLMASSAFAQGILDGYSDGTFRGDQPINRYEFVSALSKYQTQILSRQAVENKLIEELRNEVQVLRYEVKKFR
jgi:hypothetical protein